MKYRTLGKTGWQVSAVSMGCWGIGGQWGPVSEGDAIATVHAARDAGVNLFDTADSYGLGISEELVGKALRGKPDDILVATKVGNWARRHDDPMRFKTVHSVTACCHASLYRLGTDCIDLYQCHIGSPERPEIFVEAFERLKEQGKIREYGISTNDIGGLKELNANGSCGSCQIAYSILAREAERNILPYCQEHDIGVLLRGPLAKGVLTGKFTSSSSFNDTVRSGWNEGNEHEVFVRNLATVEALRPLDHEGRTLVDVALQFVLTHPAVTCPIPGMKSPEQARQNAGAADGELSVEDLALINSVCPPSK